MPRRGSRKSVSKKGSRKGSRKDSRKASRSRSRKGVKKGSKRSKKRSRKASRESADKLLHMMGGEKGKAEFVHKLSHTSVKDDKVEIHEEQIIKGDKGLLIKHYHKAGGKASKLVAVMKDDGSFSVRTMDGDKKDEKDMSKAEFLKLLGSDKHLKFALDYLKTMKGGARKRSRKSKGSKRRSRK